ncbi:MAG: hypothetical protein ABIY70_08795 [Capsulimonas sp.]|uniref:hypothetical protein n=1 Tax=Capsulimonas sp. TaxID=2494211 RepID=UPI003265E196
MKRQSSPSEEIVNWTERYLSRTRDEHLLLWPWIDFKHQPACTIGKTPGAKGAVVSGTVTPAAWTRQLLRLWARTVDAYIRSDYDPKSLDGKIIVLNCVNAEKLLWAYRELADPQMKKTPAAS